MEPTSHVGVRLFEKRNYHEPNDQWLENFIHHGKHIHDFFLNKLVPRCVKLCEV